MIDDLDPLDGEGFSKITEADIADGFDGEEFDGENFDGEGFYGERADALDEYEAFGDPEEFDGLDTEGDAFFKKMFRKIGRGLRKFKFLRKLAPIAGRIAGGFVGGPLGSKIGGQIGGLLREEEAIDAFDDPLDLEELEYEDEAEDEVLREDEAEAFGLDSISDGMAEELGALAAEAESEAEASALLGGVTIQVMSPAPVTVKRMTPVLVKGATRLGRFLRRSRRTRMLVRTIPTIQKRTTRSLVLRAQRGRPITPSVARRAIARATVKTLKSPKSAAKGITNNVVKRRRFRKINKKAVARAER